MHQYVALLRGINVGGNNLIKMADLKACFEAMGMSNVRTYIQSGNVLFASSEHDAIKLTEVVEGALADAFHYQARAVLVSKQQLREVVGKAPKGFGSQPAEYRYNVLFLKPPLTASKAMQDIPVREGVDQVFAGERVVYHIRLESRATQSYLGKIVGTPVYQCMTIRNWNTTNKLLVMLDQ